LELKDVGVSVVGQAHDPGVTVVEHFGEANPTTQLLKRARETASFVHFSLSGIHTNTVILVVVPMTQRLTQASSGLVRSFFIVWSQVTAV
jgi:hypothetical protein